VGLYFCITLSLQNKHVVYLALGRSNVSHQKTRALREAPACVPAVIDLHHSALMVVMARPALTWSDAIRSTTAHVLPVEERRDRHGGQRSAFRRTPPSLIIPMLANEVAGIAMNQVFIMLCALERPTIATDASGRRSGSGRPARTWPRHLAGDADSADHAAYLAGRTAIAERIHVASANRCCMATMVPRDSEAALFARRR